MQNSSVLIHNSSVCNAIHRTALYIKNERLNVKDYKRNERFKMKDSKKKDSKNKIQKERFKK